MKLLNSKKINSILLSVQNIVLKSGALKRHEQVLILFDKTTQNLIKYFKKIVKQKTSKYVIQKLPLTMHDGLEPNNQIKKLMLKSDLIICLTKKSLAHSSARFKANKLGARFLSLPDYSIKVLQDKSLKTNFERYFHEGKKLTKILSKGKSIRVFTQNGTNLTFDIKNRSANFATGICYKKGSLASPPDSEVNIAVVENKSSGIAVVDGSITTEKLGKLGSPIYLIINKGLVTEIYGKKSNILRQIFNSQKKNARIIGEFGIGLNHNAKIIGNMLVDEGSRGNIHLGIGSNYTIGGKNKVNFHLDHVIKQPDVYIDKIKIINKGKII